MTFGAKCREALAKERERLGGKITPEQWDAVVDNLVATEAVFRKRKPSSKRPKEGRPRNPLFDALALGTGTRDLSKLPRMMGKTIGVALADIIDVSPEVTPDELERVIAAYKSRHPQWPCTAMAIAKHWAEFTQSGPTRVSKTDIYVEPTVPWREAAAERFPDAKTWANPHDWQTIPWQDVATAIRPDILKKVYA